MFRSENNIPSAIIIKLEEFYETSIDYINIKKFYPK